MDRVDGCYVSSLAFSVIVTLTLTAPTALAGFTEVTATYGIERDGSCWGAGFVDFDGDGDTDLYIGNHWEDESNLYRNDGGGCLVDHSSHYAGLPKDRHDELWADLDEDGVIDQYVIKGGAQPSELFWGVGDGTFLEGAATAGADDPVGEGLYGRGRQITMSDFDLNGYLDIFIANAERSGFPDPSVLLLNQGGRSFIRDQTSPLDAPGAGCSSADYDLDGFAEIILHRPLQAEFLRNHGNGSFTDVLPAVFPGIVDPLVRTLGVSWVDYDDDGDLDLLEAGGHRGLWDYAAVEGDSLRWYLDCENGAVKTVHMEVNGDSVTIFAQLHNNAFPVCYYGAGGDSLCTYPATLSLGQVAGAPPALGQDVLGICLWSGPGPTADSLHLTAQGSASTRLTVGGSVRTDGSGILAWTPEGFDPPPPSAEGDFRNRLYRNEDDGTFSEVTSTAFAVNDPTVHASGAAWADYDNDGWIDVYVANGGTIETGNQPNYLFRNQGDGTFTEVAALEGVQGSLEGVTAGATWGDLDGDGFLDLFLNHGRQSAPFGTGPRELLSNQPNSNHWIAVHLRGVQSNGSGVGTRVRCVGATGTRWRTRLGESDAGFSSFPDVHVGLGSDTVCDTLQLFWPSGQVDTHPAVAADARYLAIEGQALRAFGTPTLAVTPGAIADTLGIDDLASYDVALENTGAEAIVFSAVCESCSGGPARWLSFDLPAGSVWPSSGAAHGNLVVATESADPGELCGRLVVLSNSVTSPDTVNVSILVDLAVDVGVAAPPVSALDLTVRGGNPTISTARFELAIPDPGNVVLAVYDVRGRRVRSLASGTFPAGVHRVSWDGHDDDGRIARAGVYFVQASVGGHRVVRKLTLIR